jgi:H+/gluconate symporter-like permease
LDIFIIGWIIIAVWLILLVGTVLGKIPVFLALMVLSILMPALAGTPLDKVFNNVIENGVFSQAPVMAYTIFGAWLAMVMMRTGMVESIIRGSAELAGERPVLGCILIVIAMFAMFSSVYSTGLFIAVGYVAIPIFLQSFGISPLAAAYILGIGVVAGYSSFNVVYYAMMAAVTKIQLVNYVAWRWWVPPVYGLLCMMLLVSYILIEKKRGRFLAKRTFCAVEIESKSAPRKGPPVYSFLSVVLPIILIVGLKLPVVTSFLIATLYAFLSTQYGQGRWRSIRETRELFETTLYDSFTSSTPVMLLWIAVGLIVTSSNIPEVAVAWKAALGPIIPTTLPVLIVFFIIFSLTGLYRGPANLFGMGAVLWPVMLLSGLQPFGLFALFYGARLFCQLSDVTITWNAWSLGYMKVNPAEFIKQTAPYSFVISTVAILVGVVAIIMG